MPSRSFKAGGGPPPPGYRTPSPPRYAFEPLSPRILGITPNVLNQKSFQNEGIHFEYQRSWLLEHKSNSQQLESSSSVMDTFASIALASNSSQTVPDKRSEDEQYRQQVSITKDNSDGRPSKRVRSTKLSSSDWEYADSRPVTRLEAELLLNFSQEARYAVPRHRYNVSKGVTQYNAPATATRCMINSGVVRDQEISGGSMGVTQPAGGEQPRISLDQHIPSTEQRSESSLLRDTISSATDATTAYALKQQEVDTMIDVLRESPNLTSLDETTEAEPELNHMVSASSQSNLVESPHSDPPKPSEKACDTTITDVNPVGMEITKTEPTPAETVQPHEQQISPISNETGPATIESQNAEIVSTIIKESSEMTGNAALPKAKSPVSSDTMETQTPESQVETTASNIRDINAPSICTACNFSRNELTIETENNATSWISCDGCKSWFHFACAGFKTEREVRGVDKYRCKKCKPTHGATTYVRKSARAHSAIDYAGLNEGVLKTSDENPEHHYIKPIKDGNRKFHPENFARMCPELVTADYFEKGDGMKEPIVIPATLNPRPSPLTRLEMENSIIDEDMHADSPYDLSILENWISTQVAYDVVRDDGQDALDMIVPRDLTVRQVAELYGPEERVEVIDVKSQNGEDKKWNMKRWVDYYESQGNKVVRNVISLEVSQSKLGRLIRRPKVVRDLDLQDSVWPAELQAKGDYPKVQFYCLMSVADCFTDFHIDFGGSSVFYHILKGKKTFFFIPPHERHLKKYEEWCMSNAQNWTFLGDQTKECYRVDLSEGDTMLIPAGWIHAVWTPEDSLVIGGNFLTRMHYQMQIRVAQIEKATGVARKFRYPHFQKVLWYTALRYLEEDPIPDSVSQLLLSGHVFKRDRPTYDDILSDNDSSDLDPEKYHARYYSRSELDGLPELGRYLQRTALIAIGNVTEGISMDSRNAVKRSIPKIHGEPLDTVKKFALWYTWKRGNEPIPHWAWPNHVPESKAPELTEKKLGVRALRRLEREAALQAFRVAPDRQSTRKTSQQNNMTATEKPGDQDQTSSRNSKTPQPAVLSIEIEENLKRKQDTPSSQDPSLEIVAKRQKTTANGSVTKSRKPACDSCRKRRRACKHRGEEALPTTESHGPSQAEVPILVGPKTGMEKLPNLGGRDEGNGKRPDPTSSTFLSIDSKKIAERSNPSNVLGPPTVMKIANSDEDKINLPLQMSHVEIIRKDREQVLSNFNYAAMTDIVSRGLTVQDSPSLVSVNGTHLSPLRTPGRSKACNDCRKSKVCEGSYMHLGVY